MVSPAISLPVGTFHCPVILNIGSALTYLKANRQSFIIVIGYELFVADFYRMPRLIVFTELGGLYIIGFPISTQFVDVSQSKTGVSTIPPHSDNWSRDLTTMIDYPSSYQSFLHGYVWRGRFGIFPACPFERSKGIEPSLFHLGRVMPYH